jgi:molecular chaperone DnaK (HSP70)
MTRDCQHLGDLDLNGIPPMARGVPQIEITYDLDANGILSVAAAEKSTGKSQSITIQNSSSRPKEEIERMIREAEAAADDDKKVMERVEAKNKLEAYLYQVRSTSQDEKLKTKLGPDAVKTLEDTVTAGFQWLETSDSAITLDFEDKYKEVEAVCRPIITKLYDNTGTEGTDTTEPKVEEVD